MLVGMALLLCASSASIYLLRRQQSHAALDEVLRTARGSLQRQFRFGRSAVSFDTNGLDANSGQALGHGVLFQVWSPDMETSAEPPAPGPPPRLDGSGPPPRLDGSGPLFLEPQPQPRPRPGEVFLKPTRDDHPSAPCLIAKSSVLKNSPLLAASFWLGRESFWAVTMPDGQPGRCLLSTGPLGPAPSPSRRESPGPAKPGHAVLLLAASTTEMDTQLRQLAFLLAATTLGTMVFSALVAWVAVSRGLRPLNELAGTIGALDEKALRTTIDTDAMPREVEPIVRQLNGLLGRLDKAFVHERALTANLAHELRTPLAGLRSTLEVALERPGTIAECADTFRQCLGMSVSMQNLAGRLLQLNRLETGQVALELAAVDLRNRVLREWQLHAEKAQDRGLSLDYAMDNIELQTDQALLDCILQNLLANAVEYADEGSVITVAARKVDGATELTIRNHCGRLETADIAHLGELFWRKDAARHDVNLHCGLGLALVRRCAQVMGGTVEFSMPETGMVVARASFLSPTDDHG